MDQTHNPYSYNPYPNPGYGNRPQTNPMETVAFILSIISIATSTCFFLSLPMGSMAVVLALLSRGGQMKLGTKAKFAVVLGILGIVLTISLLIIGIMTILREYGSFEAYLRAYCDMLGIDFEALYGDVFQ